MVIVSPSEHMITARCSAIASTFVLGKLRKVEQYNAIQCNTMHYTTIQYNTILYSHFIVDFKLHTDYYKKIHFYVYGNRD